MVSRLQTGWLVGVGGFEPPTSRSRTVRSSLTELHPGMLPYQYYRNSDHPYGICDARIAAQFARGMLTEGRPQCRETVRPQTAV